MEQTKDVVTQIRTHYDSFSKSHRRLADFILENLHEVAFLSINELSQRTGISPATITRFARRLDFQGYPDLQRGLYQWTIQNNIGLLEALYTPQLRDSFARAQEILHQARTIYIAGMRSSYATAYYLAFMLQQMCDNVHLLTTSTSDLPTALSDVHPEDCLLVISYARYTSSSYDIVSHFHRAGCKIVALTDSLTSPIALKATEVLIAPNGGNFSPVGAITLCNCFITSLGRLNAQQTLERMELQDKIALEHHIYL